MTPLKKGLIISPADGVIQMVTQTAPPQELGMGKLPMHRVSIFMNVFDCHVNRSPTDGVIVKNSYRPGKFFNASLDKASKDNERRSLVIKTEEGIEIALVDPILHGTSLLKVESPVEPPCRTEIFKSIECDPPTSYPNPTQLSGFQ